MRILCPKCGREGSLQRYSKGRRYRHDYRRIEHHFTEGGRKRCYVPLMWALAMEAARADRKKTS